MTKDPLVPVIDAHHHFWRVAAQEQSWRTPAHAAIARDFTPAELRPELRAAGVGATVLVQSVNSPAENDRLAAYARDARFVGGVVGWLPLRDPRAARAEMRRAEQDRWCGVRCLVARDPLEWLARPGVRELFRDLAGRGLSWDVVAVTAEQTRAVRALADAVPELRIVVDHLARPPLDGDPRRHRNWQSRVRELALHPGVALKVSVGIDVLTGWSAWDAEALTEYVAHAVDCFGAGRLMLASNWPVVLLRRSYTAAWRDLTTAVVRAGVGAAELAEMSGGTAARWYRLERAVLPDGSAG